MVSDESSVSCGPLNFEENECVPRAIGAYLLHLVDIYTWLVQLGKLK